MANKRRLGRALTDMGLDELLTDMNAQDQAQIKHIKIEMLSNNADQPRKTFHAESLDELSQSIKEYGIIQPLVVKSIGPDQYQIIAGERRFRAAKQAGLTEIPAIVKKADQMQDESIALIENIQREDLNVIDQAEAFARLVETHQMSHEMLAQKISKSRSSITNTLRLNALHPEVKQLTRDGELDMGHARALLSAPEYVQPQLAHQIVSQGLSVRQVEAMVTKRNAPPAPKADYQWAQHALSQISLAAKIQGTPQKGKVILSYKNPHDLERILAQLTSEDLETV